MDLETKDVSAETVAHIQSAGCKARRSTIREDERESHAEMVMESDTHLFWKLWGLFVTMMTFLSIFVVLSMTLLL